VILRYSSRPELSFVSLIKAQTKRVLDAFLLKPSRLDHIFLYFIEGPVMSSKPSLEDEPSLNGEEKPKLPFTEPKEPKQQQQEKVRASKLEYKTVNQM